MTAEDNSQRRKAWSTYWAGGALHSCGDGLGSNYGGVIGAFWDTVSAAIAPGARVLDLATGNGALPLRLWQRHGAAANLHIDAVDLAALAPPWYRGDTHPGITFHSGVAMEALPFASDSQDRVFSQFGLEYARRPDCLDECLRVLAPGGRLAFVMHHADSVLVAVGRSELANIDRLLAVDGLIAAARQVIPWIARARSGGDITGDADAGHARERYNVAMAGLAKAISDSPVPDALIDSRQWVHGLLSGAHGTDAATQLQALSNHEDGLRAAALRTAEMVEHALDAGQMEQIAHCLQSGRPDCTVKCELLRQSEGLLAWAVTLSPADGSHR